MKKKYKKEYYLKLEKLASEGKFDEITIPVNYKSAIVVDENYKFINNNIFYRMFSGFVRGVLFLVAPILNFFACKPKIIGKKNLKGIKSAVSISNHVFFLDNLVIRQAIRGKKMYITGAPFNCKRGLGGEFLKAGGFLPFSDSYSATKKLFKSMEILFDKGAFIHVYPEQSMWLRYEKERPLKKGAFTIAVKNNVPVVPIFLLFRQRRGLEKLFIADKIVTVKILPPIYPDKDMAPSENADNMMQKAQAAYRDTVIEYYGYPRENYDIHEAPKESERYK